MRSYLGLVIENVRVIGKVDQLVGTLDRLHGSIIPEEKWRAYGMLNSWCDTDLGLHNTRKEANTAIESWWTTQQEQAVVRQKFRKPCGEHFQYREGCQGCIAANQ